MEFFGGEQTLAETIKRDRQKLAKAKKLNIELIYIDAGYDLDDVVAQIEAARASPDSLMWPLVRACE